MKKWLIAETMTTEESVKQLPDVHPVILQLLASRGVSPAHTPAFLQPDYAEQLYDPFLFKDMHKAVDLIAMHVRQGSAITVYGDYDADGVTATAVMFKTLKFLADEYQQTGRIEVYIPHRETEGYGLNVAAVEAMARAGVKLIVTVDGGIRSVGEVARARQLGVDVIVTDHHEPGEEVPDCLVINPKTKNETYPFTGLAGVGVAFKTAQALLRSVIARTPRLARGGGTKQSPGSIDVATSTGLPRSELCSELAMTQKHEVFEKWLLDLVAIGTIADLMPLVDENRVLVSYGLVVLNKTKRVGLQRLIAVAQSAVDKNGNARELDAWQVGFQLAPRLNAAGRLDHANSAYRLLVTDDESEALQIADTLNATNQERQRLTEEIFQTVNDKIHAADTILFVVWPGLDKSSAAVLSDQPANSPATTSNPWPGGIMGLVAGKLTEKYYRPALAITQKTNGQGGIEIVGSARSIPEFNITAMLEQCAEFLTNYGGHKQAAGFTVKEGLLERFLRQAVKLADKELQGTTLAPALVIDAEITFQDISEDLYETLNKLRPFGVGNSQPKFVSRNVLVVNTTTMGNQAQHLKLRLQQNGSLYDAVGFNITDEWKQVKLGDSIDIVYYIDINEWNGNRSVQLKIIDLKLVNSKK